MDNKNPQFYDLVVDIESFNDLKNEGWKIESTSDGEKKYDYFKELTPDDKEPEKKNLNRIGVLGVSGVGKTFILKKLINKQDDNIPETKGISVIYPEIKSENLFVCIDSQGSEEPIIDKKKEKEEIYNLSEIERKKLVKELSKDKKFTEIFIQDFIIEKSNILIVVVDQLTFSEQKLINRLKASKNYDKLFVIHNTQFFENKQTIKDHIENVIKKSIFSNLKKGTIPNLASNSEKKDDEKAYYYKEKDIGDVDNKESSKHEIIHLFMGKEGSEAGNYFNDQTIDYIRFLIKSETRKTIFDIIKEIKNFLYINSNYYMIKKIDEEKSNIKEEKESDNQEKLKDEDQKVEMKNEKNFVINEEDIVLEKGEEDTYLKCINKNFELKDCIINEMGISNFKSEKSINSSFVCYKGRYINSKKNENWEALIVKAEMFVNAEDIKISQAISDDNAFMNIIISCEKKLEKDEEIEEEIENIEGGDIKEGNIKISIKINLNNIRLDRSKAPLVREPFPGIKLIYFKISENDENNKDINTELITKQKKKKTK